MLATLTVLALLAQGGPRVDEAALKPGVNLLSNCSFEAVDAAGLPLAWELVGAPADFRMANRGAGHGGRCLTVYAAAGQTPLPSARQTVAVEPGVEYVLSASVRVDETDGRPVGIALEFRDDQPEPVRTFRAEWSGKPGRWTALEVRAKAPPGAGNAAAIVPALSGAAQVSVDAVSLRRADGKLLPRGPYFLRGLQVAYAQPTWIRLQWTSNATSHRVEWQRAVPLGPWEHADDVAEQTYAVVGLRPDTRYNFRVFAAPEVFYDDTGKLVRTAQPAGAAVAATTVPSQPRTWAGYTLWPSQPLGALPPGTSYPAIEGTEDCLYVAEIRDGAIYLSRIVPGSMAVDWTKVVVDREAGAWRGMTDVAWQDNKLWLTWTARPLAAAGAQGRQYVTVFDPATGERGKIVEIKPQRPGAGTGPGGLALRDAQMWLAYLESWTEDGAEHAEIAVAPLDADGDPGDAVVCGDCPSPTPDGPCLAPFDGGLQLLYSDRAGLGRRAGWAPLMWERFNGEEFSGRRTIGGSALCRYPRALNLGRVALAAYMGNARWTEYGERFYDIVLVKLGPGAGDIDSINYADDMKYNANPDVDIFRGTIYVVYTKLEHGPAAGGPAPKSYGTYIGRIEQEVRTGG
jgi:hypothetical protein